MDWVSKSFCYEADEVTLYLVPMGSIVLYVFGNKYVFWLKKRKQRLFKIDWETDLNYSFIYVNK